MKKVIKVLPILLATPLMMANSPAPAPISENYTNLNMSLTYQGIDDKDGRYDKYAYLINITNNGDQYVAPYYTIYFYEEGARYNSHWLAIDNYQQVFSYESIAPGQTATFIGHTSETIDTSKEFVCQMEYFLIEEKMNFSNYEIKKYRNQKNTYILKTDVAKPSSYYCCVFVDVTYKGEPHTLCIQNFTRNDRTFTTNEELDLDQLTNQLLLWVSYTQLFHK